MTCWLADKQLQHGFFELSRGKALRITPELCGHPEMRVIAEGVPVVQASRAETTSLWRLFKSLTVETLCCTLLPSNCR